MSSDLEQLCGGRLLVGFAGTTLPSDLADELARGVLGGAVLFRRNVGDLNDVLQLCTAIRDAAARPVFVAVDQEGGRVRRLRDGVVQLPALRELARGGAELARRAGVIAGRELCALGFNVDFAPVLDVDSNPGNPVIGDRAASRDPDVVSAVALAFAEGLQAAGVLACGKHFPGHGDTSLDSHLDLPRVLHDRDRLERIELAPFRAAAAAGAPRLGSLMSAHVVYDAIEPGVPATLSRASATTLLREELGFDGVLFSDDLEMRALADRWPIEHTAVESVAAGCDALLVCSDPDARTRARRALVERATGDPDFADRCERAQRRTEAALAAFPQAAVADTSALDELFARPDRADLARDLARLAASPGNSPPSVDPTER